MDQKSVGEYLKRLRIRAKYTQTDLGSFIGVTDKAISRWESGAGMPEISNLMVLAKLYGITVDDILNLNEGVFTASSEEAAQSAAAAESEHEQAPTQPTEKAVSNCGSDASGADKEESPSEKSNKLSEPSLKFRVILLFAYLAFGTFTAVLMSSFHSGICMAFFIILSTLILAAAVIDFISKYMPRLAYCIVNISLWSLLVLSTFILMILIAAVGLERRGGPIAVIGCAVFTLLFIMQLLYELFDFSKSEKIKRSLNFAALGAAFAVFILTLVTCFVHGADLSDDMGCIVLTMTFASVGALTFALAQVFSKWINILTLTAILPCAVLNICYLFFSWNMQLSDTLIYMNAFAFNLNLCIGFSLLAVAGMVIGWFFEEHKARLAASRIISVITVIAIIPLFVFTVDAFAVNIIFESKALATASFMRIRVLLAVVLSCIKSFEFELIFQSIRKRRQAK